MTANRYTQPSSFVARLMESSLLRMPGSSSEFGVSRAIVKGCCWKGDDTRTPNLASSLPVVALVAFYGTGPSVWPKPSLRPSTRTRTKDIAADSELSIPCYLYADVPVYFDDVEHRQHGSSRKPAGVQGWTGNVHGDSIRALEPTAARGLLKPVPAAVKYTAPKVWFSKSVRLVCARCLVCSGSSAMRCIAQCAASGV